MPILLTELLKLSSTIRVSGDYESKEFILVFKAHHFNYPINRCNEVAQVSVFLGVVGVILFGLSRRTGKFILGVVSIVLVEAIPIYVEELLLLLTCYVEGTS